MSEDEKPDPTLTLAEITALLPATGELMHEVGDIWWKVAYAGRGGNWPLAAYFVRRTRKLLRKLSIVRPKYTEDIAAFQKEHIAAVLAACQRKDGAEFERALAASIDASNELHVKWAHAYIRWKIPEQAPTDLDLKP